MLLKFVLANPAVTCVIPGTGSREHMLDNVHAGVGAYPDAALRKRIVDAVGRLSDLASTQGGGHERSP